MNNEETMAQVEGQCKAVAHMATCLAQIHSDLTKMFAARTSGMADIAEIIGRQTAEQLQILGDILNGMDAVTDDDEWVNPIIQAASERWPSEPAETFEQGEQR